MKNLKTILLGFSLLLGFQGVWAKSPNNERITINLTNASVQDALKIVSQKSGFNLIVSAKAQATAPITLFLENITWQDALSVILQPNHTNPESRFLRSGSF